MGFSSWHNIAKSQFYCFHYQLLHIADSKNDFAKTLGFLKPDFDRYKKLDLEIKAKSKERKTLVAEKKSTPALHLPRHHELAQRIATLTEDIEELKSERAMLLNGFGASDAPSMKDVKQRIDHIEEMLEKLRQQEIEFSDHLKTTLSEFSSLHNQAMGVDPAELEATRLAIRPEKDRETAKKLQTTYGRQYNGQRLSESRKDVAALIGESVDQKSIQAQLCRKIGCTTPEKRKKGQER